MTSLCKFQASPASNRKERFICSRTPERRRIWPDAARSTSSSPPCWRKRKSRSCLVLGLGRRITSACRTRPRLRRSRQRSNASAGLWRRGPKALCAKVSEWKEKGGFVWRKAAFSASVCRLAPGGCAEGRLVGAASFCAALAGRCRDADGTV